MPAAARSGESIDELRALLLELLAQATEVDATGDVVQLEWLDTPVGPLLAGANSTAVVLLEFGARNRLAEQLTSVRQQLGAPLAAGSNRWLAALRRELGEYFAGRRRNFELPLAYPGSEFQQRVWSLLLQIPYGETWSYLDMACKLGDLNATRAVGTANGSNRIAILIPCHRVINADGKLGGYGGGLWRKQVLLDLERGQGKLF